LDVPEVAFALEGDDDLAHGATILANVIAASSPGDLA